jgi:DNA-binding NarL/FixJ family response regulator
MIKLGARSYVPKDTSPDELTQAIGAVLTTGYCYTPRISQALARNLQHANRHTPNSLFEEVSFTTREKEVLRLICSGLTTTDIATKLFISHRTVEGHRQRLLDKSGSSNVASLVAFAAKHDLLEASL